MKKRGVLLIGFFAMVLHCYAQVQPTDSLRYAKVLLQSGKTVVGEVVSLSDSTVVLSTDQGLDTIMRIKTRVLNMGHAPFETKPPSPVGEMWYSDWNQLFPTARPTGEGKANYRNDYLVVQRFSIGVSNQFSIDGGLEILSIVANEVPAFYLQPKISIGSEKSYVGLGVTTVVIRGDPLILPFFNYTFGSEQVNGTFGITAPFQTGNTDIPPLMFNFGTNLRLGKSIALTSEVMVSSSDYIFQFGFLVRSSKNLVFRCAFIRPWDFFIRTVGFPVVGMSVPL